MAITTWDYFYPQILTDVAGCPLPTVDNALANSAAQLLRTSKIWVMDLDPIDAVAGQGLYDLDAPEAGQVLLGIEEVRFDGFSLDPLTPAQARNLSATWKTETGGVCYFVNSTPYELQLVRVPDTSLAGAIELSASIGIKSGARGIEQWIAEEFTDELVAGAKQRLMGMPQASWSNPQFSLYYGSIYAVGLSRAIAMKATGRSTARIRTTPYPR